MSQLARVLRRFPFVEVDRVFLGDADIPEIGDNAQQRQAGALFQEVRSRV